MRIDQANLPESQSPGSITFEFRQMGLQGPSEGEPVIVTRRDEVWDTRSPLGMLYDEHRKHNEVYYSALLAIERTRRDLRSRDHSVRLKKFFFGEETHTDATRAWGGLRRSVPGLGTEGNRPEPTAAEVAGHLELGVAAITEHAIVSYCGVFEQFLHSWTLNYLLALLEAGTALNDAQRRLVRAFSPKHGELLLPSVPRIVEALPILKEELEGTAHVFLDYESGEAVTKPVSVHQTAYAAICFWREWRNLLVHDSGVVTQRFFDRQSSFAVDAGTKYPAIRDLQLGQRLHLDQDTFRPFMTAHWKAAQHLRALLLLVSGERRGHIRAPGAYIKFIPGNKQPNTLPPLLLPGDHQPSVHAAYRGKDLTLAASTAINPLALRDGELAQRQGN